MDWLSVSQGCTSQKASIKFVKFMTCKWVVVVLVWGSMNCEKNYMKKIIIYNHFQITQTHKCVKSIYETLAV